LVGIRRVFVILQKEDEEQGRVGTRHWAVGGKRMEEVDCSNVYLESGGEIYWVRSVRNGLVVAEQCAQSEQSFVVGKAALTKRV